MVLIVIIIEVLIIKNSYQDNFIIKNNNTKEALVNYEETKELYDLFIKLIYKEELLPLFYKKYSGIKYKYDIYALGITFYKIAKFCQFEQTDDFINLIRNMIHYNPIKRYDVNQCMKHPFINP